jgi:hypothetical protein
MAARAATCGNTNFSLIAMPPLEETTGSQRQESVIRQKAPCCWAYLISDAWY